MCVRPPKGQKRLYSMLITAGSALFTLEQKNLPFRPCLHAPRPASYSSFVPPLLQCSRKTTSADYSRDTDLPFFIFFAAKRRGGEKGLLGPKNGGRTTPPPPPRELSVWIRVGGRTPFQLEQIRGSYALFFSFFGSRWPLPHLFSF